jgi:CheY-like chemotaxis protein
MKVKSALKVKWEKEANSISLFLKLRDKIPFYFQNTGLLELKMTDDKSRELPELIGRELPRAQADKVIDELVKLEPIIIINDSQHEMNSKILADISEKDGSKTLVIQPLVPDHSKDIIGDNLKVLFKAHYVNDGLHFTVNSYARIDRYIIHLGFPALVLTIVPPVRQKSQLLIGCPDENNPVFLKIPSGDGAEKIVVHEISINGVKGKSSRSASEFTEPQYLDDLKLQLDDLEDITISGQINAINSEEITLQFHNLDEKTKGYIQKYLEENFGVDLENSSRGKTEAPIKVEPEAAPKKNRSEEDYTHHILMVDDEPDIHTAARILFEENNYKVSIRENGSDGIKFARLKKPDLIILDVDMPVMNGLKALSLMRKFFETKKIPVLMLTGHTDLESIESAIEIGITGYLSKPYDPLELLNRVKNALSD